MHVPFLGTDLCLDYDGSAGVDPKRYEPDLQLSNLYESQPEMASECFGEMESEQSGT